MLAGATPYLRVLATVVASGFVARGAIAAQRLLDGTGDGATDGGTRKGADRDFLELRVARARVLIKRIVPSVHGLAAAVTAGADDLYAIPTGSLAV